MSNYSKYLLGFDRLNMFTYDTGNYPPYNIVKQDNGYLIEVAASGATKNLVKVTVKDDTLTISYSGLAKESREYLYRGVSRKSFTRSFLLMEGYEVGDAWVQDGFIYVEVLQCEEKTKVRQIEVK